MSNVLEFPAAPDDQALRAQQIEEVRRMLRYPQSAYEERNGHRVLQAHASPHGWLENVETVLLQDPFFRYRIVYDAFADVIRVDGVPLRDEDLTRLRLQLATTYELRVSQQVVAEVLAYVTKQKLNHAHPVREYLQDLQWDGRARVRMLLPDYAGTADTGIARVLSLRFMIACVARAMEPGCKSDCVLVLAGKQGIGKSTFFRTLCGAEWFRDDAIDLRSKDAMLAIQGCWIYELAELASTRTRENETVKAFLSRSTDSYRPPYARCLVTVPRSSIFVASTNEASFLRDPTGARRFWPIEATTPNLRALHKDRDQLWAEAVHLWESGQQWHLTDSEEALLREAQEQYQHEDPWLQPLREWLAAPANRCARGYTIAELLDRAIQKATDQQSRYDEMRLGTCLVQIGYVKRRRTVDGKRVMLWQRADG